MVKHWGKLPVDDSPVDLSLDAEDYTGYTVPIPEGLTERFQPSQPVTTQQMIDYNCGGKEPYPGYGEEKAEWEEAWEQVNRAQMIADGATLAIQEPVLAPSEFDEFGEPIEYADEVKVVVRDDDTVDCYVPANPENSAFEHVNPDDVPMHQDHQQSGHFKK